MFDTVRAKDERFLRNQLLQLKNVDIKKFLLLIPKGTSVPWRAL